MIKVFEAFAGYGSQSMALRRLGIDFEVVGISEIDKYAIQDYMPCNRLREQYYIICNYSITVKYLHRIICILVFLFFLFFFFLSL